MPEIQHPLHAAFLAVYLFALVAVGAMKAGKIKTQEDFSLAGRGLPGYVLVGTLLATWIGTGSIFGNAEKGYGLGAPALLIPLGSIVGMLLIIAIAGRIRRFGQFTIQDILEARFGPAARVLATVALVGAYLVIVSYQYRAGASALTSIFGMEPVLATSLIAAFVIAYTALAGMFSVAYTDVANGVMMIIGIFFAIALLWGNVGGYEGAVAALPEGSREIGDHWTWPVLLGATLPAFLLIVGDANVYQRFISAKDIGSAKRAALGMLVGVGVLETAIILLAILATGMGAQGGMSAPENPGYIVIHAAFEGLPEVAGTLGTIVGAMLVATVMAVVVSTADSFLLAPSTSLVRDVYQRFINPDVSGAAVVRLGRILVVVTGLVALALAFSSDEFFSVAIFAYTIYGCAITPALFAAFFWRRATSQGAVASIVTGVTVAILMKVFGGTESVAGAFGDGALGELWGQIVGEPVLIAFPLSLLALVGVSLATPAPSEEAASVI